MGDPIEVIISRHRGLPDQWDFSVAGVLLGHSRTPFLDACRVLLERGHDPFTLATMRHESADSWALKSTIRTAAGLRVRDNKSGTPVFDQYRAFDRGAA